MKFISSEGLTFDDVLLVPQYNCIESRQDVSLKTKLTRGVEIDAPLLSANMDTLTEVDMMCAMDRLGCVGILHRFMSLEVTKAEIAQFKDRTSNGLTCASVGTNGESLARLEVLADAGVDVICIDVAHGHSVGVLSMLKTIKEQYPNIQVIAGNVATPEATKQLIQAGADAIKVGIGPGSLCTTRIVTGNGVPQLTAVSECYEIAKKYDVPIIADGGIRNSGDIVKALAAGASSVMVGSLLSGTDETPGEVLEDVQGSTKRQFKRYRGMASNDAMTGWKGKDYHAAPEGESKFVEYRGPVTPIVEDLLAGIRSGMTYQGVSSVSALRNNAVFRIVSANCLLENRPHGL